MREGGRGEEAICGSGEEVVGGGMGGALLDVGVYSPPLPYRFEFVPVEGQEVVQVYGLVTEPKEEIYVQLRQRSMS